MSRTAVHKDVLIVAGEASGDLHGSNLLRAAAEIAPQLSFYGVGGERMRQAGCEIVFPADELSVMGLVEVFAQLPRLIARFRQLKRLLQGDRRPDLLLLIDFPDFNLRLAKVAKRAGVPVLYYITPKVWAWRKGRAKTIAERTDQLALIFPFEPEIFAPYGVPAEYVGNPLLDEFVASREEEPLRSVLSIDSEIQVVGIFPGSRNSELEYIFPTLRETMQKLHQEKPQVKFLLPVAPSLSRDFFAEQFAGSDLPVILTEADIYAVARACDAILTVSGTVTLQISLAGTPHAILYRMAPLSYAVGKRVVKVEHVGLTNIVAGRSVVREFIQDAADPVALCAEVIRLLDDQDYRQQLQADLAKVRERLGEPGCSRRVAALAAQLCAANAQKG